MTKPVDLQIGFTSPMFRDWPARLPKRNPIGFVHFGQPEEEREVPLDTHPDVRMKQEDRIDKQRWIDAMADDII
jgi:hypothetical protein